LWPEVHSRFTTDPKRIYAAGFSGGAIVAWYLAQFATPPLAGIIACGGRPADEIPTDTLHFAHFGTAGTTDFNYSAMKLLDAMVASRGMPHQFRAFEGGHTWMPREQAAEAVEWMEVLAMRAQLRPVDTKLAAAAFERNMERARTFAASAKELEALRCYETTVATFDGLLDVAAARAAIRALERNQTIAAQQESERRADAFESKTRERLAEPLDRLEQGLPYGAWEEIADDMDLRGLKRRAAKPTPEGIAAARVLAWAFGRAHFYIPQSLGSRPKATTLRIAAEIRPGDGAVWRELAVDLSRSGMPDEACDAIQRAIGAGLEDWSGWDENLLLRQALQRKPCAAAIERLKSKSPSAPR
jgi:hypothetical protein